MAEDIFEAPVVPVIDEVPDNVVDVVEETESLILNNEFVRGSEGFNVLCNGFVGYANEVNINRSIPDYRDGLKPVHRRLLYVAHLKKANSFTKSLGITGETASWHPHGNASTYGALVLMVDNNGASLLPYFEGQGNWGKVYSSNPAAAERYTEVKLGKNGRAVFLSNENELRKGVNYHMRELQDGAYEPEVLPARIPNILINESTGIGVSIATNIPSFNPNDVIRLAQRYAKTRDFGSELIVPDFSSGGYVVQDPKELKKLMLGSPAQIITRAHIEIVNGEIILKSVPKDSTVESIERRIRARLDTNDPTLDALAEVNALSDKRGVQVSFIPKKGKGMMEKAYEQLQASGELTRRFRANMITTGPGPNGVGRSIIQAGVYEYIKLWFEFRVEVIRRSLKSELPSIEAELRRLGYLIKLSEDTEAVNAFIDLLRTGTRDQYTNFLIEYFNNDIDPEVVKWICERRVVDFRKSSKYREDYILLENRAEEVNRLLNDSSAMDQYIYDDLQEVQDIIGEIPRRSEITNQVHVRIKEVDKNTEGYFTLSPDGVLQFTLRRPNASSGMMWFEGSNKDIAVIVDTAGKVARFRGDQITNPVNLRAEGIALRGGAQLLMFQMAPKADEYQPVVFHPDGYAGRLTMSSWYDLKSLANKVNSDRARLHENKGIFIDPSPDYDYYLALEEIPSGYSIAYIHESQLPDTDFGRRQKVFARSKNLHSVSRVSLEELELILGEDHEEFNGVMRKFVGDEDQVEVLNRAISRTYS